MMTQMRIRSWKLGERLLEGDLEVLLILALERRELAGAARIDQPAGQGFFADQDELLLLAQRLARDAAGHDAQPAAQPPDSAVVGDLWRAAARRHEQLVQHLLLQILRQGRAEP